MLFQEKRIWIIFVMDRSKIKAKRWMIGGRGRGASERVVKVCVRESIGRTSITYFSCMTKYSE